MMPVILTRLAKRFQLRAVKIKKERFVFVAEKSTRNSAEGKVQISGDGLPMKLGGAEVLTPRGWNRMNIQIKGNVQHS